MGVLDLDEKLELAKKGRTWTCRFHPTDGFHEVGCPHVEWTSEQLLDALNTATAMNRVYQHELWNVPLDGSPAPSLQQLNEMPKHGDIFSPTYGRNDLSETMDHKETCAHVSLRLREIADRIELGGEPFLMSFSLPRECDVRGDKDERTRTLVRAVVTLSYPLGG